ncbi:MAG: AAA-like domain-containing protein [Cyanobacteria bacterium J06650_10]
MLPDEIVRLVKAKGHNELSPVKELILRQAWEGETYSDMARSFHYEAAYLKKVAAELWQFMSEVFGEPISKANVRSVLEARSLTVSEHQLVGSDAVAIPSTMPWFKFKFPSGPVPAGSPLYIERPPIEDLAYQEVSTPGGLVRIKAPYQMGKSSLLVRILAYAAEQNYRSVYLDFHQLNDHALESQTHFLRWFCANVSQQLGLAPNLDEYWDEEIGSGTSCSLYFKRYLLGAGTRSSDPRETKGDNRSQNEKPLVLVLNEIDRIFEHEQIARIFLPLLRFWHEEAKRTTQLQKLRLVVAYSTEAYIPLNVNQSPFNVGLPLKLPPFTLAQIQDLAQRHELEWSQGEQGAQQLEPLQKMTGGHPYLVQLALYYLCLGEMNLTELLRAAPTLSGIYCDHLRSHLTTLQSRPELAAAFRKVVAAIEGVSLSPLLAYELDSMGLIVLKGNQAFPSCELYQLYFSSQLQ